MAVAGLSRDEAYVAPGDAPREFVSNGSPGRWETGPMPSLIAILEQWSEPLLLLAFGVIAVGFVADIIIDSKRVTVGDGSPREKVALRREVYWISWSAAAVLGSVSVLHRGGLAVIGVALFVMVFAVCTAVARTPFLKIRGRVIAAHDYDRREGMPAQLPLWLRELQEKAADPRRDE